MPEFFVRKDTGAGLASGMQSGTSSVDAFPLVTSDYKLNPSLVSLLDALKRGDNLPRKSPSETQGADTPSASTDEGPMKNDAEFVTLVILSLAAFLIAYKL